MTQPQLQPQPQLKKAWIFIGDLVRMELLQAAKIDISLLQAILWFDKPFITTWALSELAKARHPRLVNAKALSPGEFKFIQIHNCYSKCPP